MAVYLLQSLYPRDFIQQFDKNGQPGLQRDEFESFSVSDSKRTLNFNDFDKDSDGTISEGELVDKILEYAPLKPLTVTYVEDEQNKRYHMYGSIDVDSHAIIGCKEMREEEGELRVNAENEYHYYVRMSRAEGERQLHQLANDPEQMLEEAWVYFSGLDQEGHERSYWFEIGVGEKETASGMGVEIPKNEVFNAMVTSDLASFNEISLYHFHPKYFPTEGEHIADVTDEIFTTEALTVDDFNTAINTGILVEVFDLTDQYDARLLAPSGRWMVRPAMDRIVRDGILDFEDLEMSIYDALIGIALEGAEDKIGMDGIIEEGRSGSALTLTSSYARAFSLYTTRRYGGRIAVAWNPLPPLQ